MMRLNTIAPACGSRMSKARKGRGIGSGLGKTCGRGHKGQKSRSGGYHKIHFEGGQMPIQRRLPKMGFRSKLHKIHDEVTLSEISKINEDVIDLNVLKKEGLVRKMVKTVKIILSGEILRPVKLRGLLLTKGAREAVLNIGGCIED